jgi:succinyl-CoA synthetase beta subunit
MDLLEYQAKELFREMGIPVLPSQRIDRPMDLKGLTIPYPIVLKSQVYVGGRGLMGGVRFAENTIDAVAAAQAIFNLPIMGEYPTVLLAEAKYNAERELYLAVVVNRAIRRPVLLGSAAGGVQVQAAMHQMQHVVVEGEFSPFYARRLALKMGLQGELINAVTRIIEKMYTLFDQKDLDLVEINPLGVRSTGAVMALDGKVVVNDDALTRHPELAKLAVSPASDDQPPKALVTLNPEGQIGIIGNGAGLTMATMDLVSQAGSTPIHFLNVGSETHYDWSPQVLCDRLETGLALMSQTQQVKVILVNIISGTVPCDDVAQVIGQYYKRRGRPVRSIPEGKVRSITGARDEVSWGRGPQLIVRLLGPGLPAAKAILATTPAKFTEELDEAVAQTIAFRPPA